MLALALAGALVPLGRAPADPFIPPLVRSITSAGTVATQTPAADEPVAVGTAQLEAALPERITRGERVQIDLALKATYENPFDPRQIAVDALVRYGTEPARTFPAFARAQTDGAWQWAWRWLPTEAGPATVQFRITDRTGTVLTPAQSIRVQNAPFPGLVKVSAEDRRYFATADGRPFFPAGANLFPTRTPTLPTYLNLLDAFRRYGLNYTRLAIDPSNPVFALERIGPASEGRGVGQYDLAAAERLDTLLETARENNVQVQLALESYGPLLDRGAGADWDNSPYAFRNGGPLRVPSDYWSDADMDRLFRQRVRYLIARYGSYPNLMAWELFNQADVTADFDARDAGPWHQRQARFVREADPYGRMVTTSLRNPMGIPTVDRIPELDFTQTIQLGSPDPAESVAYQINRKADGTRPHLVAAVAADLNSPRQNQDLAGLQVHDPLWVSVVSGGAGAATAWWTDSYLQPLGLFKLWGALAKFTDRINWTDELFRASRPTLAFPSANSPAQYGDVELDSGIQSFVPGPLNAPRTVTIDARGNASGALPISSILHGRNDGNGLFNPVTFRVNLPRTTVFEVFVTGVSPRGGGVQIRLDSEPFLTRVFTPSADPEETRAQSRFNGALRVRLPAGIRTVSVLNPNRDWVTVSYRFIGLRKLTAPPIESWALLGNTRALVWMRPRGRSWTAVAERRKAFSAPESVLGLKGFASGWWRLEFFNTYTGQIIKTRRQVVPRSGRVRIFVPPFTRDLALRMTYEP